MSTDDQPEHEPRLLALDTGGTMTDSFIVDEEANYTVGKAQTTPDDEAVGVRDSFDNGLGYWGTSFSESAASLDGVVYAGTAMLNRLLEREGEGDIGVITTGGFEDHHRMGRAIQSWADLSYAGRLHAREHEHPEPIVPRENIKGVRERVNMLGVPVVNIYEDEIREAVHDLLDRDVRVICVCMIFSYANQSHEQKVKEIAEEIKDERDDDTPVWLSSEQNPVRGETPRLNTLVLEAYAVEPSREQLYSIEDSLEAEGLDSPFRVLTSSGGTISPDHDWLVETMLSGPIGGVFGGEFLADELGIDNLVCSDVGGTSFDVAMITEGHYPTRWDQSLAQFLTNIPMTALDSIGSGTGSYLRVDRASNRIEVGPDSAGYLVGVSNEDADVTTPTVTDCTALLGYINPDFFLGGDIPIDVDAARDAIDDQLASPLDEDPIETARGVLDVVERDMANELRSMVLGLGYSPENYSLISYGGGGPLHAAGYSQPLDFQDVLIPDWAAAFSAFGCACADAAYRYDQSLDVILQPDFSNAAAVADQLTEVFEDVREQAAEAFRRDDIDPADMAFEPSIRAQYTGMLDDLEVSAAEVWDGGLDGDDVERLIEKFEEEFGRVFQRAARSPENGYQITVAIGEGVAPSPKPELPNEDPVSTETPPEEAHKGTRDIYWDGDWHEADIWRMDPIQAGNVVEGPAVTEAPATTMLVPPGFEAPLDENRIYHLQQTDT
ncbi:hydantoinase/oxoprolinase family protein [Halorientalis marina]|jgi:N-methylhydantoinase A/acetone carboxylase beta subunit|uniref:hydantoinase/oxoprolinase family protein n=1 Tax=Halorientalis marina TaxID=2931976 RepID=UPI001FF18EE6|nr:hydantoinase/oxoprolinase family protein [Halorientalis marina]